MSLPHRSVKFVLAWVGVGLVLSLANGVVAQETEPGLNVAATYEMSEVVEDGDIIVQDTITGVLRKSRALDSEEVFGVVARQNPVVYRTSGEGVPVVRSGEVMVNVTLLNGPIQAGDYVVASEVAGSGQKVARSTRHLVGIALEGFTGDESDTGQVRVALRMGGEFRQRDLRQIASLYLEELGLSALNVFANAERVDLFARYLIAALIVLVSVWFSFRYFGRNVTQGLESIGRNPLASRRIQTMILLNVLLIAGVVIGAILLALFIIRY